MRVVWSVPLYLLTHKVFNTIAPYQQNLERYVQIIKLKNWFVLAILKFKLPNKQCGQLFLFTAILKLINFKPNSVHPTLIPSMIFKGHKFDINALYLWDICIPTLFQEGHEQVRCLYRECHHLILRWQQHNMIALILGRNTEAITNKFMVIMRLRLYYQIYQISSNHLVNLKKVINHLNSKSKIVRISPSEKNEKMSSHLICRIPLIYPQVRPISKQILTPMTRKMIVQPSYLQI